MSIFGNIMSKIFPRGEAKPATAETAAKPQPAPASAAPATSSPTPPAAQPAASPAVDVGAVLDTMAGMKPDGGGNYRSSIVDLLKLLDLDSSLNARKELAAELGVHSGPDGSAEQNIALHKAVMDKLEANGGIIPDSLRT